jgi:glyoxylase-like metal-dependent hydrolase (beta-lactamase superfamily II)
MRITSNIALVASGKLGFGLTDPLDCNVYAMRCGDEWALIDAGAGRDVNGLLRIAREDGIDPARIRHLLLTHGHADHAGGCAELKSRLGVTVWASADVAQWLSAGDEAAISLPAARDAGIYPADYRLERCIVDKIVQGNTPFHIDSHSILPIDTPGHADGHVSFLMQDEGRACLFIGDLLMCSGRVLLQYTWDCSLQKLGASILALDELHIDALFPGHLHFCLSGGQSHIAGAASRLRRLLIPDNL